MRKMPQKSFFVVAEMGGIYPGPNYIERQRDSDNFLESWYTLVRSDICSVLSSILSSVTLWGRSLGSLSSVTQGGTTCPNALMSL